MERWTSVFQSSTPSIKIRAPSLFRRMMSCTTPASTGMVNPCVVLQMDRGLSVHNKQEVSHRTNPFHCFRAESQSTTTVALFPSGLRFVLCMFSDLTQNLRSVKGQLVSDCVGENGGECLTVDQMFEDCKPKRETEDGDPCSFPFEFQNIVYYDCFQVSISLFLPPSCTMAV